MNYELIIGLGQWDELGGSHACASLTSIRVLLMIFLRTRGKDIYLSNVLQYRGSEPSSWVGTCCMFGFDILGLAAVGL